MMVTPKQAEKWLKKRAPNRDVSDAIALKYASDMVAGRWHLTHEAIAIDARDRLQDGQHRLEGVALAKVPVKMRVCFECDPKSIEYIDLGRTRQLKDVLQIAGCESNAPGKLASIARAMLAGLNRKLATISVTTGVLLIKKYGDDIAWVVETTGPSLRRAGAYAVIASAVIEYGRDRLKPFCAPIKENVFTAANEPGNSLYRTINHQKRLPHRWVYGITTKAVHLHLSGKTVSVLKPMAEALYGLDLYHEFNPHAKDTNGQTDRA